MALRKKKVKPRKRVIMKFGLPHGGISTICRNLFWICWINWIEKNFKWFLIYTDVYNGQHIRGYDILSTFLIIRSRVPMVGGMGGTLLPSYDIFFEPSHQSWCPPWNVAHLKMKPPSHWKVKHPSKKLFLEKKPKKMEHSKFCKKSATKDSWRYLINWLG